MSIVPPSLLNFLNNLEKLPGIGPRGAARIAFYLLRGDQREALELIGSIDSLMQRVNCCKICFHLTENKVCSICENVNRDAKKVLIVEHPQDLINVEKSGQFEGVYHVLAGRLDILGGVRAGELTGSELIERIHDPSLNIRGEKIEEVILGLNATWEGDATALWLYEELRVRNIKVTRLARGLSPGGALEVATVASLADALHERREFKPN